MEAITPGLYGDISNGDYHAGPGLSSSNLKKLSQSPLHYKISKENPSEETDAMKLGSAVHCAVLEPDRFYDEYIIAPEGDKRSKAVKAALAEIEATGKIPLSADDFNSIQGMANSIHSHPLAGKWLSDGTAEQSGYWLQHVKTGNIETDILCKCRPDYVKEAGSHYVIIDLKTSVKADPDYFSRKAFWDYQYHISAAHYLTGMEAILGERAQGFIFIVVEKTPPYAVNVFQAGEDFINAGRETNQKLYNIFATCQMNDDWPCYPAVHLELKLPRGAKI